MYRHFQAHRRSLIRLTVLGFFAVSGFAQAEVLVTESEGDVTAQGCVANNPEACLLSRLAQFPCLADRAARMIEDGKLRHLSNVLLDAVGDPQRSISVLPFPPGQDSDDLLGSFDGNRIFLGRDTCTRDVGYEPMLVFLHEASHAYFAMLEAAGYLRFVDSLPQRSAQAVLSYVDERFAWQFEYESYVLMRERRLIDEKHMRRHAPDWRAVEKLVNRAADPLLPLLDTINRALFEEKAYQQAFSGNDPYIIPLRRVPIEKIISGSYAHPGPSMPGGIGHSYAEMMAGFANFDAAILDLSLGTRHK